MRREPIATLEELKPGVFYQLKDLQSILRGKGLLFSLFTIRDYESWKCQGKCKKRHDREASVCPGCGGQVRPPLILSPRTRGGVRGVGHRRYRAEDIEEIVRIMSQMVQAGRKKNE